MLIRLDELEIAVGKTVGITRHDNGRNRRQTRGLAPELSEDFHILGAFGELAVARILNIYPGFILNTFKGPDLEPDIQVRTTRHKNGRLIMTADDPPFHKYVLVTGDAPELDIVGWIWGYEGQDEKWLTDPKNNRPPAYFVPRDALKPIETLNEG